VIRSPAGASLSQPHALAALVVGVGHLLAIGQGKRLGVEADGDAIAGDLSQRGDVSLKGGEEGLLVGGEGFPCTPLCRKAGGST